MERTQTNALRAVPFSPSDRSPTRGTNVICSPPFKKKQISFFFWALLLVENEKKGVKGREKINVSTLEHAVFACLLTDECQYE